MRADTIGIYTRPEWFNKMRPNKSHLSRDLQQGIVKTISDRLPLTTAIYLYGSVVTEMFRADSDVDIAVLILEPLTVDDVIYFKNNLGLLLRRDIDLLDMRRASVEMAFSVLRSSIQIFSADLLLVGLYETALMSMWSDLQIDRREIVEDIAKRGHVYGC